MRIIFQLIGWVLIFQRTALAQEIRDVKPPVDFPPNYVLFFSILAILFLLGVIACVYLWKKFRNSRPPTQPKTSWEIALECLDVLRKQNPADSQSIKDYYSELADIIRRYIEARFMIRAPEMTTEEFFAHLRNSDRLNDQQKKLLSDFLNSSDMVKFAKYAPTREEIQSGFNFVERFVQETKEVPRTSAERKP